MKLPTTTGGDITKFNNLTKEHSPNHSSMHHKPEGDYKLWAWPMWDMRLSVGVGVSKFVTGHFVIKAIIALGNVRYEWRLLLAGYTLHSLYWCLNSVRKREECPVSPPLLSLRSTDAGPQSSGNIQWPEGDDIILEQLWLTQYSVFYSNHIATSFPVSSGHLNPLIMYQQHWSSVYCKSPVYLVLICTLCLVLINLCGGRALQAFTATVMSVFSLETM